MASTEKRIVEPYPKCHATMMPKMLGAVLSNESELRGCAVICLSTNLCRSYTAEFFQLHLLYLCAFDIRNCINEIQTPVQI